MSKKTKHTLLMTNAIGAATPSTPQNWSRVNNEIMRRNEQQRTRRMDSVIDYSDSLVHLFNENVQMPANTVQKSADNEEPLDLRIARKELELLKLKQKQAEAAAAARLALLELQLKLEKARHEKITLEINHLNSLRSGNGNPQPPIPNNSNPPVVKNVPVAPPLPTQRQESDVPGAAIAVGVIGGGLAVGGGLVVANVGIAAIAQAALAYALTPALAVLIL